VPNTTTEYRAVVTWEGSGKPIKLTVYDPDGVVVSVSLSPKCALEMAKELIAPAVAEIKFQQWGAAE